MSSKNADVHQPTKYANETKLWNWGFSVHVTCLDWQFSNFLCLVSPDTVKPMSEPHENKYLQNEQNLIFTYLIVWINY
jgi:hypothetical protein